MVQETCVRERQNTYDYDRANEHSVDEEIARLREARRLALKTAAVLVEEVRV